MNKADILKLITIILVVVLAVGLISRIDNTQDREETGIVVEAVKMRR